MYGNYGLKDISTNSLILSPARDVKRWNCILLLMRMGWMNPLPCSERYRRSDGMIFLILDCKKAVVSELNVLCCSLSLESLSVENSAAIWWEHLGSQWRDPVLEDRRPAECHTNEPQDHLPSNFEMTDSTSWETLRPNPLAKLLQILDPLKLWEITVLLF